MITDVGTPFRIRNSLCGGLVGVASVHMMADDGDVDDLEMRSILASSDDDSSSIARATDTGASSGALREVIAMEAIGEGVEDCDLSLAPSVELTVQQSDVGASGGRSVVDYVPLWGCVTLCGLRPEMEDAVVTAPWFYRIPLELLDGVSAGTSYMPAHFFGVYDGHGGAQVANYCQDRLHVALVEEIENVVNGLEGTSEGSQKLWERIFTNCFVKVDDEVGGKVHRSIGGNTGDAVEPSLVVQSEPVAPDTVGSTAVVSVICSSHIIVANCGDSRAVLCRGKQAVPLSVDHKPDREDEYERIEAAGGKVIQWNGYRVFGVLAMSRSIGDRYLKPWIIPEPEVTIVPRTGDDECLILASDGLWDVMSNEEVCEVARKRILVWHKKNGTVSNSPHTGETSDPAAQAAADYLSKLALRKGTKDNITVIVVDLKAPRKIKNRTHPSSLDAV